MSTNSCGGLPGYDAWKTTPPIEEGDPDEAQCPLCGRWVDYHELDDGPCAKCDPSTRECEGCGQQKPIEEMQTCFLPGTGETYQCEQCRGLPTGGTPGCAAGTEREP